MRKELEYVENMDKNVVGSYETGFWAGLVNFWWPGKKNMRTAFVGIGGIGAGNAGDIAFYKTRDEVLNDENMFCFPNGSIKKAVFVTKAQYDSMNNLEGYDALVCD